MAGLENLFAAEPTLPTEQTTKLPDNPQEWAAVISTQLRERYPDLAQLSLTVEFRKKDEPSGTAIGGVHVEDQQSGKKMIVPFIAKKFELCPLDIWMEVGSQAVHPLTLDAVKKAFFSQEVAAGLDQRPTDSVGQYFNDSSTWNTNYPPLQGRYSYASAGYTLLDQISDTMDREGLNEFKATLKAEPSLLLKFQKHGHQELIQKLARKSEPMTNDFVGSALKLIPVGVASIKKEGPDKYSLLSMADRMFDLVASEWISRDTCASRLSKITKDVNGIMNEVDQMGEKMLVVSQAPSKGVWLYDDITEKPELIDEFVPCTTKSKTGLKVTGVVIPQVVDFAGRKKGVKLFLSPDHSSMQDQIAGLRLPDSEMAKIVLAPRAARVGQTGTFVLVDDGKAIATEPCTIKSIENHGPMRAVLLDGTEITIKRTFGEMAYEPAEGDRKKAKNFLDAHGMVETRPREYIIPSRMLWVPMEGFQDVSSSKSDYLEKEASSRLDANPMTVRYTGTVYQVDHVDMGRQEFNERELKVVLASKGAGLEKIAQITKKARAVGRVRVHGLGSLRKKADIVKLATETESKLKKIAASLRVNLIKAASEVEDAATVDKILSLNFLNASNVAKFVSYRPVFERVLDYLAELVLASRLGLKDLDQAGLGVAIAKIQDVVVGLERLETAMKKPQTKTANASPAAEVFQGGGEQSSQPGMPENYDANDPYANGMVDGEMGTHLYLDKARRDGGQALLSYMNGKRQAEINRAQASAASGAAQSKKR